MTLSTVMTWNRAGVGSSADVLVGRVAAESLKRLGFAKPS